MTKLARLFEPAGHHAFIVTGPLPALAEAIGQTLAEKLGRPLSADADSYFNYFDRFGITDSRDLRQRQASRQLSDRLRYFILAIKSITPEAQNALLKVLEEPAAGSRFIIVVERPELFLPTVLSRCEVLSGRDFLSEKVEAPGLDSGRQFLASDLPARLQLIKRLLGDKDRARNQALDFLNSLELALRADLSARGSLPAAINRLFVVRRLMSRRGSATRLLLEDLALSL
ncbi:MAG: hypothetical protein WDZ85_03620 [Candidatus Paceibacterota bacterium]